MNEWKTHAGVLAWPTLALTGALLTCTAAVVGGVKRARVPFYRYHRVLRATRTELVDQGVRFEPVG